MSQRDEQGARNVTLLLALYDLALSSPDAPFLVESQSSFLTYHQTYALVSTILPEHIQHEYPILAHPRTGKVILVSPNNTMVPLVMLSSWFMSTTVVPISPKTDQEIFKSMVELIRPDVIIYAGSLERLVSGVLSTYQCLALRLEDMIPKASVLRMSASRQSDFIPSLLNWLAKSNVELSSEPPSIDANQRILCLFTSSAVDSSTLKCVSYTHSMVLHSGHRFFAAAGDALREQPLHHLGFLPLSHVFGLCFAFLTLVLRTGGSYTIFDRAVSSPDLPLSAPLHVQLQAAIEYHQPLNCLCLVPAIFQAMSKNISTEDLDCLKRMRFICVGGAPTPEELFQWTASHGIAYCDGSGMTELSNILALRSASDPRMKEYGLQIISGIEGFIEKEKEGDSYGELIIRGQHLPRGYDNKDSSAFNYNALTGVTTLRTGDLYEYEPSINHPSLTYVKGQEIPTCSLHQPLRGLKYIARLDDLAVLASGLKVDALSLERSLNNHPDILRSAVIPVLDQHTLAVLMQLVEDKMESGVFAQEELLEYVLNLNHHLPIDKRIQANNIFVVKDLPTTTKFSLNRKLVRKIWLEHSGNWPGATSLAEPAQSRLSKQIRDRITRLLADIFNIPADYFANESATLSDIPLTSLDSVRLARTLEEEFSVRVTEAQLYGVRSVGDIHALISTPFAQSSPAIVSVRNAPSPHHRPAGVDNSDALVITGSACRFPGHINSLSDFSSAMLDPRTYAKSVTKDVPPSRWKVEAVLGESIPPIAWLDDDAFANLVSFRNLFGLSPADAENMSPNARLAMQVGYQAIEDAGISPRSLNGRSWGIFTSVNSSGWRERRVNELDLPQYSMSIVGSADDAVGARLSYFMNLTGPAIEIKTACSSSAVAVHQACAAIRSGDCEAAIVIASTTHFHPSGAIFRMNAGIASKTGQCATFSDGADGFLPAEGAVAIVIQKGSDAQCEPYARIRGSHVAQDGRSRGFFSPNPVAQERLLTRALERASCSAEDIDYYETHGTGTRIGDAIELQTIGKVFGGKRSRPLTLGSVKAVLGHTEECAGLASILKCIVCLKSNLIPPQPNITRLNQQFDFIGNRVQIYQRPSPFFKINKPRCIGISSFGLSGTLAHIILEDPTDITVEENLPPLKIFLISAANHASFKSLLRRYADYTVSPSAIEDNLDNVCRTTQLGREHQSVRRAWPVKELKTLSKFLFDELEQPTPRPIRKPIKVGLWFGLPSSGLRRLPECPLLFKLQSQMAADRWHPSFDVFARQLVFANMIRAIGCDVSAVGGEGLAEYAAAVYADIFPSNSVFREKIESVEHLVFVIRGAREKILECLTQWAPSVLALRESNAPHIFLIKSDADSAYSFISLGEFELLAELRLPMPLPPAAEASPPSVTYISGALDDVLDVDVLKCHTYWDRLADFDHAVDGRNALKTLRAHCDVIVTLGGQATWYESEVHGKDNVIHLDEECLESGLAQLYEYGATIDWTKFGTDGRRARLPTYEIL